MSLPTERKQPVWTEITDGQGESKVIRTQSIRSFALMDKTLVVEYHNGDEESFFFNCKKDARDTYNRICSQLIY